MNAFPLEIEEIVKNYVYQLECNECWLCDEIELDCECIFICEHHRHADECECEDSDEPMMMWIYIPNAVYTSFVFIGIEKELEDYSIDIRNKGNGYAKVFAFKENIIEAINYFIENDQGTLTKEYDNDYEKVMFTLTLN